MGWKELPTWLKGGLIALVIILIDIAFINYLGEGFFHIIIVIIGFPMFIFAIFLAKIFGDGNYFLFSMIPYSFILGSLIGWIVGKVKSKEKVPWILILLGLVILYVGSFFLLSSIVPQHPPAPVMVVK